MIAKVTRGGGPGRAVRYLFSAGRHNEHEDPHVVAAAAGLGVSDRLRPSKAELKELEAAMEAPRALYGRDVESAVCWHLALSTKGGLDRDLSDEEWAAIAQEAVHQLGFDSGGGQSPCRWVAARHGRSEAGNDHVHLVVNLEGATAGWALRLRRARQRQGPSGAAPHPAAGAPPVGLDLRRMLLRARLGRCDRARQLRLARRRGVPRPFPCTPVQHPCGWRRDQERVTARTAS